jgi:Na+/proline symporter
MNFEDLQKMWQAQDAGAKVTINADVLLKEVRRNQQQFWATIFWRDVREVGVAFLLTLFFSYHGLRHHDWTDFLVGFACFGVGSFMVIDRLLQRKKRPAQNDSIKACVQCSLHQVNRQILLLKNVFWWYLLPIALALEISICVSAWHSRNNLVVALYGFIAPTLIVVLIYWGIYRLNQFAVHKSLEPRKRELEALLSDTGEPVPPTETKNKT